MALDAFLKIPSIDGDSTDEDFPNWIIVESFSWGEERPAGGGIAVPLEVQLVTNLQRSSPSLFAACANGTALGTAQLHVRRPGDSDPPPFLKWDLGNAVIGSYRVGANEAAEVVTDQFSIAFTAFTYAYTLLDSKGHSAGTVTKTVTFTP